MNKIIHSKKISIYDPYTTWGLILGLLLMYVIASALSGFFIWKFLITQRDYSVFVLLLVINIPWIWVTILLFQDKLFTRLSLRFGFDEEGIHCFRFGQKLYTIAWESIHTFGVIGYSAVYLSKRMLLFSTDSKETVAKSIPQINNVSQNRVIIQFRPEIWCMLSQCLPKDMFDKLSYSLSREQDCFHKR